MSKLEVERIVNKRIIAADMAPMSVFRTAGYSGLGYYIACRPSGFLLNSSIVKENQVRHSLLVMNTATGSISYINGDTEVIPVASAKLRVEC